jgi:DNA-binding Lrp family transcriptional regulator
MRRLVQMLINQNPLTISISDLAAELWVTPRAVCYIIERLKAQKIIKVSRGINIPNTYHFIDNEDNRAKLATIIADLKATENDTYVKIF